jgi:hypothetical protein
MLTLSSHSSIDSLVPETENEAHSIMNTEIEVSIEGEVENPGKFSVRRGSTVEDLVVLGLPKATADLKRIKMKKLLKKGECVKVPAFKMINFFLKFKDGTIEEITVKKGTRFLDLPNIYFFNEGVDIARFNKKRFLKDGETVTVNIKKGFQMPFEAEFISEIKNN